MGGITRVRVDRPDAAGRPDRDPRRAEGTFDLCAVRQSRTGSGPVGRRTSLPTERPPPARSSSGRAPFPTGSRILLLDESERTSRSLKHVTMRLVFRRLVAEGELRPGRTVVMASAGNAAVAAAHWCRRLALPCVVVIPAGTAASKGRLIEADGAQILRHAPPSAIYDGPKWSRRGSAVSTSTTSPSHPQPPPNATGRWAPSCSSASPQTPARSRPAWSPAWAPGPPWQGCAPTASPAAATAGSWASTPRTRPTYAAGSTPSTAMAPGCRAGSRGSAGRCYRTRSTRTPSTS